MPFIEFYLKQTGVDTSIRSEDIIAVQAMDEDNQSCLIMVGPVVFEIQGSKDETVYAIQNAERNPSARVAISPEHTKILQGLPPLPAPSVKA